MNNIILCFDKNYEKYLYNILKSFKKYHDIKKYNFNLVITVDIDERETMSEKLNNKIQNISVNFNYNIIYFTIPDELVESLSNYNKLLFNAQENKKKNSVFINYANWSRFYLTELIPNVKKGLYIDMDVLFLGNIDKIFKISLENDPLCIFQQYNRTILHLTYRKISKKNLDNVNSFQEFKKIVIKKDVKKKYEEFKNIKKNYKKILEQFDIKDIKNKKTYNCGVLLFNFEQIKKINLKNNILKLINLMYENNNYLFKTGTEKTMNLLISNPKVGEFKNNVIKKKEMNLDNINILHFKGIKKLEEDDIYLKLTNEL